MNTPLWTPTTPDDLIAWGQGYTAGYDTGHDVGRKTGWQAGQEAFAGQMTIALKLGMAGIDLTTAPIERVIEVISTPMRDLIVDQQRAVDQLDRRRQWDRANRLEVSGAVA